FDALSVEQGIELGIVVVASIEPGRRDPQRVKGSVEEIGIIVASYPPQRIELKAAPRNVGIERCEFKRVKFDEDAHALPLVGEGLAEEASRFLGRSLEPDVKTRAIDAALEAGLIEDLIGKPGIEGILANIRFVGPVARRQ